MDAVLSDIRDGGDRVAVLREIQRAIAHQERRGSNVPSSNQ
jgi:hypothetical protein